MSLRLKFLLLSTISIVAVLYGSELLLLARLRGRTLADIPNWSIGATLLLVALAVTLVNYGLFALLIQRRLRRVARVIQALAADPTTPLRIEDLAQDELGRLSAAFDSSVSAAAEHCASLEGKLAERSQELSATMLGRLALVEGALDGIVGLDDKGNILEINPSARKLFRCDRNAHLGCSVSELIEWAPSELKALPLSERLFRLVGQRAEVVCRRSDGNKFSAELTVARITEHGATRFAAFLRDLSAAKQAEGRLRLQLDVTRLIASRLAAEPVVRGVLERICAQSGWDAAVYWQVDEDQSILRCHQIVCITPGPWDAWKDRLGDASVRLGSGFGGGVWQSGQADWRKDLLTEPDVDTVSALEAGLRSAACAAVIAGEKSRGIYQFFSLRPKQRCGEELALLELIGAQLGLCLAQESTALSLAESERRFRSLVVATSQMYYCANTKGEVIEPHMTWVEYTGQTPEETLGYGWTAAVHPDDMPLASQAIQHSLATGEHLEHRCRVRRHDGEYRLFEIRGVPVLDEQGQIVQWVGTCADIHDQIRAEQALRESEAQLQALFACALDGMIILDDKGYMLDANPAACEVLGCSREELRKRRAFDFTFKANGAALWRLFRRRGWVSGEFQISRPDGSIRELECEAIADFQPGRHLSIFRDITERKQLQDQLHHAQKMDAVGRLAGGVAHDFNNLLTIILGLCEVGLDEEPNDPLLTQIDHAGRGASALTRQLLAFSRKQVIAPTKFDLNELVKNLETMSQRLIGENIELSLRLEQTHTTVEADPSQIEQAILNLIINSRDAMPEGGKLTIETKIVKFDRAAPNQQPSRLPGEYVKVSVIDSGCGMDEATRSRIFEPFFTTKEQGQGTGLGLATAYGIVEQSGGFIEVESHLGIGTSMEFYLPRCVAPILPPRRTAQLRLRREGTETILLVEDAEDVRRLARRALETRGYKVLEAADGEEALQVSAEYEGPIRLLVTDVVMPVMGGRELADRLSTLRPEMRVLFMSGYTDDSIVREGVREEGIAFLQKPFTPDVLGRKVREVLASPESTEHHTPA